MYHYKNDDFLKCLAVFSCRCWIFLTRSTAFSPGAAILFYLVEGRELHRSSFQRLDFHFKFSIKLLHFVSYVIFSSLVCSSAWRTELWRGAWNVRVQFSNVDQGALEIFTEGAMWISQLPLSRATFLVTVDTTFSLTSYTHMLQLMF